MGKKKTSPLFSLTLLWRQKNTKQIDEIEYNIVIKVSICIKDFEDFFNITFLEFNIRYIKYIFINS